MLLWLRLAAIAIALCSSGVMRTMKRPVKGLLEANLPLHLDDDRLPLFGEVGALRCDEQGIEMFLHGFNRFRLSGSVR
jgi:hypothetical protein